MSDHTHDHVQVIKSNTSGWVEGWKFMESHVSGYSVEKLLELLGGLSV